MCVEGSSDDSPCSPTLQWKKPISSTKTRLRTHWCSHPFFKKQSSERLSDIDCNHTSVNNSLTITKDRIRQAAIFVRNHYFSEENDTARVTLTIRSSIARAVWTGNMAPAKRVHTRHALGLAHVGTDGHFLSRVSPTIFEVAFISAQAAQLDKEKKVLDTIPSSSDSNKSYKKREHK